MQTALAAVRGLQETHLVSQTLVIKDDRIQ